MPVAADVLLAGPRGRRVCLEAALACSGDVSDLRTALYWSAYWAADGSAGLYRAVQDDSGRPVDGSEQQSDVRRPPTAVEVAELIGALDPARVDTVAVDAAMIASIGSARYWQEPDGEDLMAATPDVRSALTPFASRIAALAETRWWSSPMDSTRQIAVAFDGVPQAAGGASAGEIVDRWRRAALDEEARSARERPVDPAAHWSGTWWAHPPSELAVTMRDIGTAGPAWFDGVEDGLGWTRAVVTAIDVPAHANVYEIDGSDAWTELCRRHPLEVTASRRHDWYRATGRAGRWVVPDWSAVGREYDGVHLTVAGYLATAGRALSVGGAAAMMHGAAASADGGTATVLAGWDPDATYWFVPVRPDPTTAHAWERDDRGVWRS